MTGKAAPVEGKGTVAIGRLAAAIDEDRLWRRHMALAELGATAKGGVNRPALSEEEIAARRRLIAWGEAIGLKAFVDGIGNLFLRLEGREPEAPAVLVGSHLDTQPTGGKFDGAYGVLAALEALEAIAAAGGRPRRAVELVAWTNEEGSRFAPGMMGSEAFAKLRPVEEMLAVADAAGVAVKDALERVLAATPEARRRAIGFPVKAYLEAHIEQGPELEARGIPVGVVTGIQGARRFRLDVFGEEAHAGTAPRRVRKDALLAALRIVAALDDATRDAEDITRFTVGLFRVEPNAPSVVPARVHFSVDLRHPDASRLTVLGDKVRPLAEGEAGPCRVEVREIARAEPLYFPEPIRNLIRNVADALSIPNMPVYSAAGHDARQLHRVCPSGMIFVPCEGGVSHNERENAKPEDLAAGAKVLVEVVWRLANESPNSV